MKKIIVHCLGGLGNQLFSCALGISLSRKYGRRMILDTQDYYNGYFRPFVLNRLTINDYKELKNCYPKIIVNKIKLVFYRLHLLKEKKEFCYQEIDEKQLNNYIYIDGYWQSEKYFLNDREYILNAFRLKCDDKKNLDTLVEKYNMQNKVAIHIRRGDYIGGGRLCSDEYYEKALEILEDKIGESQYAIFSDDIEYAKQMKCFSKRDCFFVEKNLFGDDVINLFAMSACKHQIIVNSSYSWWAAWLNTNNTKIIIAPELPYLENTDFYPEEWIKVSSTCK